MTAETVSKRIFQGILQVVRWIVAGVGYIFFGLGVGLGWIGRRIGKLGGITRMGGEKEPTKRVERTERAEEITETLATSDSKQQKSQIGPATTLSEPDVPTSRAEILAVIRSAPYKVFPKNERQLLEGVLTLKERPVRDLMIPKDKIIYVGSDELLGPMTLDRLYQSRLLHFPVKNPKGEVIGAIHTASLNSLEVKESFRAGEILDPNICYIREDYTMAKALDTFLRNDCFFCLVVNNYGKVVGMVNFDDLAKEVFGELRIDDFRCDDDPLAVAKRRFPVEIS